IVDLTTSNPNVLYELGLRHAVRPSRTVLMKADGGESPFNLVASNTLIYRLMGESVTFNDALEFQQRLASALMSEASEHDSPIFRLIEGYTAPQIAARDDDASRDRAQRSNELKQILVAARAKGVEAVREAEQQLGDIKTQDPGIVTDLLQAYRSVGAWEDMLALVGKMPAPLAETVVVRQQLALALNRAGRGEEAEKILRQLLVAQGASSETYGLLGRIYKDRWQQALHSGDSTHASEHLKRAIEAYRNGFETDWRDVYTGINAAMLMEVKTPSDAEKDELIPVIRYAIKRHRAAQHPEYWDLDLAVLTGDEKGAHNALSHVASMGLTRWAVESATNNVRIIRQARERRKQNVGWLRQIEERLLKMMEGRGGLAS
ncbi:MAG: DUF4071 domain-containing protein, partial [Acidobacteria bacterium]|nr:DUF4071 domain-containing protein [Acidobacteriota bacterium]